MTLTRDAVRDARDQQLERVDVPEWGGHVYVRSMTGADRDEFDALAVRQEIRGMRVLVVERTACDEEGVRIFEDGDASWLAEKNAAVLERIFEAGCRVSGIGSSEVDRLEGN